MITCQHLNTPKGRDTGFQTRRNSVCKEECNASNKICKHVRARKTPQKYHTSIERDILGSVVGTVGRLWQIIIRHKLEVRKTDREGGVRLTKTPTLTPPSLPLCRSHRRLVVKVKIFTGGPSL